MILTMLSMVTQQQQWLCCSVLQWFPRLPKAALRGCCAETLQLFEFMDGASDPGSVFVPEGWGLLLFMFLPHNDRDWGGGGVMKSFRKKVCKHRKQRFI